MGQPERINNQGAGQAARTGFRGIALVVDDEAPNRLLLTEHLEEQGYRVIKAENGQEAVTAFTSVQIDIVFMDIMMPVMDGLEATKKIKSLCDDKYIPVIFITAVLDEATLSECVSAGGDDFLTKPYNKAILNAKILAHERICEQNRRIKAMYEQRLEEESFVENIYHQSIAEQNTQVDAIKALIKPVDRLSGDILLTCYTPNNDLYVLLGDFSGHGYTAALGAVLASETFQKMARRGCSPETIIKELNKKLFSLLPRYMCMATQFVSINYSLDQITFCNCGMPDILHIDGSSNRIIDRLSATTLALGAVEDAEFQLEIKRHPIKRGDHIMLLSDGLLDAINAVDESFGIERLENAITSRGEGKSFIEAVKGSLDNFSGMTPQVDDISLIDIPCTPEVLPIWAGFIGNDALPVELDESVEDFITGSNKFGFRIEVEGAHLKKAEPVALLLREIGEMIDIADHGQPLYVILSELYNNALDHGVLKLESKLKHSAEGFTQYLDERESRLHALETGHVNVDVTVYVHPVINKVVISVIDSGDGFDYQAQSEVVSDGSTFHGRGMMLTRELCDSFEYKGNGNHVEAVYSWSSAKSSNT